MKTLTSEQNLLSSVSETINDTFDMQAAELVLQEVSGNVLADGTEQVIYVNNAPLGSFKPSTFFVDMDNMAGGDTTVLRVYYRISNGGAMQLLSYIAYVGADGGLANGIKLAIISLFPSRYGIQITLQQTAGVNTTYDWQVFEEG